MQRAEEISRRHPHKGRVGVGWIMKIMVVGGLPPTPFVGYGLAGYSI
jgi:hypothetical protein